MLWAGVFWPEVRNGRAGKVRACSGMYRITDGHNRRPADQRVPAPDGIRPPEESRTLLTAEPLDLDYKHEIIGRVHQERDRALAVWA